MQHRHLVYPVDTAVAELPSPAILDILDRGDLDDWLSLLAAVSENPAGELAERVAALVDAYPMYGTSALWRAWIERCRVRGAPTATHTLGELRRLRGMTQASVAARMGISQSDVSKLERRSDLKLSTLSDYLAALELPLHVVAGSTAIELPSAPGVADRLRSGRRLSR